VTLQRLLPSLAAAVLLGGCFEGSCYESNAQQRKFLDGLTALAKPALASNNPLAIEEAAKQTMALSDKVGAFSGWCGTLKVIEGNAQTVAITIEIGPNVSLYAFNDWTLAMASSFADLLANRAGQAPPPGLSGAAIAQLKTFRLGQQIKLAGQMGEIAGSGLFDLSRMFGKSDADNRQFLQAPHFVARIDSLAKD
jgi:hypothetical protein